MRELIFLVAVVLWIVGIVTGFMIHWLLGVVAIFAPPVGVGIGLLAAFL